MGRVPKARRVAQAALDVGRQREDHALEAAALAALSSVEGFEALYDAARGHAEQALELYRLPGGPTRRGAGSLVPLCWPTRARSAWQRLSASWRKPWSSSVVQGIGARRPGA